MQGGEAILNLAGSESFLGVVVAKSDIWVVPHGPAWGLKLELHTTPFAERATRDEAIVSGRALAKQSKAVLVILDEEGRIEERESYRGIPRAPADFISD